MTIQVYDDIFDKLFLTELTTWLLIKCTYGTNNVANCTTSPYGFEGSHRLMGCNIYNNPGGSAEKYWEHMHKEHFSWSYQQKPREKLNTFWGMYRDIQNYSKNKCLLQGIEINLQFKGMDGTSHKDGADNQTAFIVMLAYHDINGNEQGGEFFHEPSGEKISFKQGRCIEMTASDSHRANPFNVPHIPRFSVKFTGMNDEKTRIYIGDNAR